MARTYLPMFLLGAIVCFLTGHVEAVDHIVGRSLGWTIPENASYYNDWAKTRTFNVGDKLVFLFTTNLHNVVEVDGQKDFDGCSQDNTIKMYSNGPTIVEIKEPGDHYYICSFKTHCKAGQKLSIKAIGDPNDKTSSGTSVRNYGAVVGVLSLLATLFIWKQNF